MTKLDTANWFTYVVVLNLTRFIRPVIRISHQSHTEKFSTDI